MAAGGARTIQCALRQLFLFSSFYYYLRSCLSVSLVIFRQNKIDLRELEEVIKASHQCHILNDPRLHRSINLNHKDVQ